MGILGSLLCHRDSLISSSCPHCVPDLLLLPESSQSGTSLVLGLAALKGQEGTTWRVESFAAVPAPAHLPPLPQSSILSWPMTPS